MCGLHSISIGQSHIDAMIGGDFVVAGFVRSNEMARATSVNNGLAVVGWFEGGN